MITEALSAYQKLKVNREINDGTSKAFLKDITSAEEIPPTGFERSRIAARELRNSLLDAVEVGIAFLPGDAQCKRALNAARFMLVNDFTIRINIDKPINGKSFD